METGRKCGANKSDGSICKNPAGYRTSHPGRGNCTFHFGNTASHRKKAANEIAADLVATYGLPVDVDPHEALLQELHRTNGHVAWLGAVIGGFEDDELAYTTELGIEDSSIWIKLYQAERAHLVKTAKTAIDAGVSERAINLAERQGELIAQVIKGVLQDLGMQVTPEVATTVRRHLMAITAESG